MDYAWIWKAILIVVAGTILLRIAGRKSISQMTLAQTVIMIGIGSLLIQPLADKNIWITFGVGLMLVLTLIFLEYSQLKLNFIEKLIKGSSKVVIRNGKLDEKNMKKLRFTIDTLETQLRQKNVFRIADVEWATLEPDGQIGFILKDQASNATKADIQSLKNDINTLQQLVETRLPYAKLITQTSTIKPSQLNELNQQIQQVNQQLAEVYKDNLFTEVDNKSHFNPPPKHLQ